MSNKPEKWTAMEYGKSQWGSPIAVCPVCKVKCIYWDEEDKNEDGYIQCYCLSESLGK